MAISSDVEQNPLFIEKTKNRLKECSSCLPISLKSEKKVNISVGFDTVILT